MTKETKNIYSKLDDKFGNYSWYGLAKELERTQEELAAQREVCEKSEEHNREMRGEVQEVLDWFNSSFCPRLTKIKNIIDRIDRSEPQEVEHIANLLQDAMAEAIGEAQSGLQSYSDQENEL